jgi:CheY-like chemotaxis protein
MVVGIGEAKGRSSVDNQPDCGPRILIIDDDEALRRTLVEALASEGYRSVGVQPIEALDTAQRTPPDLILLDVLMPETDGRHLCRRLQAAPATRAVPIVFVTGVPEFILGPFRAHSGRWSHLHKPFTLDELFATVQEALAPASHEGSST